MSGVKSSLICGERHDEVVQQSCGTLRGDCCSRGAFVVRAHSTPHVHLYIYTNLPTAQPCSRAHYLKLFWLIGRWPAAVVIACALLRLSKHMELINQQLAATLGYPNKFNNHLARNVI